MPGQRLQTALLLSALAIAALVACASEAPPDTSEKPGRGVYVPARWDSAKKVGGHHKHLETGKVKCHDCHDITSDDIGGVTVDKCAKCHEQQAKIQHDTSHAKRFGANAGADCTICHGFAERPKGHASAGLEHGPEECKRCHHTQQGSIPAVTVHGDEECLNCHKPHDTAGPKPAPCDGCHEEVSTTHKSNESGVVATCTTCHQHQHAPASAARSNCQPCHSAKDPIVPATALFEGGHTECVACHEPHDPGGERTTPCESCHEHLNVLGGPRHKGHGECKGCHKPHDVLGSAANSCRGCHTGVSPNHPRKGRVGDCTGCHDAHPNSRLSRVRNCTSCHQDVRSETGFHEGVSCRGCHAPHDFMLAVNDTKLCSRCHASNVDRAARVTGHSKCTDCHGGLPHRPSALLKNCGSCHGNVVSKATTGHSQCQNCHEPHAGQVSKACSSCHQKEHRTAPGGHRECNSCHDQHQGVPVQKACANCHQRQANTAHGHLKANCSDCHRPHGPEGVARPPSCATCHSRDKLGGLHASRGHVRCNACHSGHDSQRAKKTECIACHNNLGDHHPEAPNCASCHLFTHSR